MQGFFPSLEKDGLDESDLSDLEGLENVEEQYQKEAAKKVNKELEGFYENIKNSPVSSLQSLK